MTVHATTTGAPAAAAPARKARRHPVIDVFGPTVQGEGPDAGTPSYFARFGGCDFRCSWCDTEEAVLPERVRAEAEKLTAAEIAERLAALPSGPRLTVLSGGNPALHHLDDLVRILRGRGQRVAVETQGSVWRDWLGAVDRLVVSPKPPSSGMFTERHRRQFQEFMCRALAAHATWAATDRLALKVVVFDQADLEYAEAVFDGWPYVPAYLSVGTDQEPPPADDLPATFHVRQDICERYRWLCEQVCARPALANRVRVLPQLHCLAWGHERAR